jgi:hypothetical protein
MTNMSMTGMTPVGGPVGGMPTMNNGAVSVARTQQHDMSRANLNTYIYEYFLKNELYAAARAVLNSNIQLHLVPGSSKTSPARRRDENGNVVGNGVDGESMDTDSKDDIDSKRPDDLPAPKVPSDCPQGCFLSDWWSVFWDIYGAHRGRDTRGSAAQYVQHTQVRHPFRKLIYVS